MYGKIALLLEGRFAKSADVMRHRVRSPTDRRPGRALCTNARTVSVLHDGKSHTLLSDYPNNPSR